MTLIEAQPIPSVRPDVRTTCRACLSTALHMFLPMGDHPPANLFIDPERQSEPQPAYPLNAQACLSCGLIQVADQLPPEFFSDYIYVPSLARTMHDHFSGLADRLAALADGGLIVDIGCNDGLLLGFAQDRGARTLGVDPAANLAPLARERGVEVEVCLFDAASADRLRATHGLASVIVTTNTFNHIDDLDGFMTGVGTLLAPDGWMVIEVPWSRQIVATNQFDNIYHEHLSELSLLSIQRLGARFGLSVADVEIVEVHGGSLRVFLRRADAVAEPAPSVEVTLAAEREARLTHRATYDAFASRVDRIGLELNRLLAELRASGRTIAGYGAPAKGTTLLNYFRIGPDSLDFLVDRNPLKQGLLSPGMAIPVLPPEAVFTRRPDYLLVLAWNFFDEIRAQMSEFEAQGGRWIVPLPVPRILPEEAP
jgi:SAM-dependent methyltransferase